MRMLFMPKPMLLNDLDIWVKPDSKKYDSPLWSLHIVVFYWERNSNLPCLPLGKRTKRYPYFKPFT